MEIPWDTILKLAAGELLIWRDSDDNKTYLVFEDPDEGTRKVEMS